MQNKDNIKSDKLKIALVANATWNIYNFRLHLVKMLEKNGVEVIVIAPIDEYIHYLNKTSNIRHIPLHNLARKGINPIQDLSLAWTLKKIYEKEKPDLIIHYTIKPNIYGNLSARWAGVKSACVVTGLGYTFLHEGMVKNITQWLYKFSFKSASKVIFENEDDEDLFLSRKIIKPEQSVAVKGCGVDTAHFVPNPKTQQDNKFRFLFIGRLLYDKGIVEFVEAAKKVHQLTDKCQFDILGELDPGNPSAINEEQLVQWIDEKLVFYHGVVQDVRPKIQDADVVVLPSYREGMSRVLLEATSMAKPIITTKTAGCREIVDENKNGLIIPVGDVSALVEAMMFMHNLDSEQLLQMGQNSRVKALKEFDQNIITDELLKIIENILGQTIVKKPQTVNQIH
ncbi:MAG: glycosyltransferase family 4 protein [Saprospiraceae bacterium]|nr:glycosyltransferase family 4 protein [Saprospiraceae bacterium]